MMLRQRHHIALLLMSLALVLLGAFLWLFLKKTWDDEAAKLRRETSLLFVNAVRGIESQAFDKLIVRRWEHADGDTSLNISIRVPERPGKDSARIFAYVQERSLISEQHATTSGDTAMDITWTVQDRATDGNEPSLAGAISMLISSSSGDSLNSDSIKIKGDMAAMLERKFGEAMQQANLPVHWQVLANSDTTAQGADMFIAGQYADLGAGKKYRAEISDYRMFLLRRIGPQILFSCLLLALTALAFGFFYQSLRRQMRLTEIKNDFIRNMTHELKTPLSTVSVAIEALQHFDALADPERTKEYLAISQMELNRLSLLVDKVLQMALFEQGEPQLKRESLDLRQLVQEVVSAMKLQFEKHGAALTLTVQGDRFNLSGDRLHLLSVVYNLLDNALKYSLSNPKIEVFLQQTPTELILKVSDNGRGIPKEYQDRIFEKFFRVPTGDVHDVKGHGLGLNYVSNVLRMHHGRIEMESQPGSGSRFTVYLPLEN